MQKRTTEEKNYNHYNIDGSLAEKKARVYKDIENTLPCYACEQGLGNESSGLWKDVDDMIFEHIFINGIDYTAKELFNHINATRLDVRSIKGEVFTSFLKLRSFAFLKAQFCLKSLIVSQSAYCRYLSLPSLSAFSYPHIHHKLIVQSSLLLCRVFFSFSSKC